MLSRSLRAVSVGVKTTVSESNTEWEYRGGSEKEGFLMRGPGYPKGIGTFTRQK